MRPQLKVESFLNTRQIGIYVFKDGCERMVAISLWQIAIGIEWKTQKKKPRFSEKKFLNSVKDCSEAIRRLNQSRYPHRHWGENSEHSEADLNP